MWGWVQAWGAGVVGVGVAVGGNGVVVGGIGVSVGAAVGTGVGVAVGSGVGVGVGIGVSVGVALAGVVDFYITATAWLASICILAVVPSTLKTGPIHLSTCQPGWGRMSIVTIVPFE